MINNTTYTATITTESNPPVEIALASAYSWTFTTAARPPADGFLGDAVIGRMALLITSTVTATFSEAMSSCDHHGLDVYPDAARRIGRRSNGHSIALDSLTATLTPTSPLAYNTTYTATITTGVQSTSRNFAGCKLQLDIHDRNSSAAPQVTAVTPRQC